MRLELHGSRDSIAVGLDERLPLRSVEPGAKFPAGPPHDFFLDRFAAAYRAELVWQALTEGWDDVRVAAALRDQRDRRGTPNAPPGERPR